MNSVLEFTHTVAWGEERGEEWGKDFSWLGMNLECLEPFAGDVSWLAMYVRSCVQLAFAGKDLLPDLEEETITEANINPIHTGLDILQDPLAEYPKTQKVLMLSTLMGLTMTNPSR